MAENESLDLNLSKRWQLLLRAIFRGDDPALISQRILQTLQKAWQATQRQMKEHGTSLQEVIQATIEMKDVGRLYRQTRCHDYVRLFDVEQHGYDTEDALMNRVVDLSLKRVIDQIRQRLVGTELCPSIGVWNQRCDSWLQPIRADIERLASRLAERPDVAVRVKQSPAISGKGPANLLNLSLLSGLAATMEARP